MVFSTAFGLFKIVASIQRPFLVKTLGMAIVCSCRLNWWKFSTTSVSLFKKAYLCHVIKKKEKTMEYSIIIEKNPTTGVYIGQCSQIPEAMSQGNTLAELMTNMKEAIELAIECRRVELKDLYKNRKIFHRKLTVNA